MNFKRIARTLVCLLLVCALVVNISPIKSKAVEPVSTALGIGIAASLLLGTAGIIFSPTGQEQFEAIGHSFQTYMYQWGTSAEVLDDVEEFFTGLVLYGGSGSGDDDDDDFDHRFNIPEAIRRGVAAFTAAAILAGSLVVPDKMNEAPDGYVYYNGFEFPIIPDAPDGYSHSVIGVYAGNTYCWYSEEPFWIYISSGGSFDLRLSHFDGATYYRSLFSSSSGKWNEPISFDVRTGKNGVSYLSDLFWSNHDIVSQTDNSHVVLSGSAPTSYPTVYIEPEFYAGDIPDKVKDGSLTEETLELPLYEFDYTGLASSNPDLSLATTALLQSVGNGTITYEDYLASLQPSAVPNPDPEPEPEPEPDPTTGADDIILGDIHVTPFFEQLTDVVTAPFKWIWEKLDTKLDILKPPEFDFDRLKSIVTAPAEWIWEKIETYVTPLLDPDTLLAPLPDIIEVPFRKTWEYIQAIPQEIADAATKLATKIGEIPEKLEELGKNLATQIEAIPGAIADAVAQVEAAVDRLIQPEENYLTDKVNALCSEFAFADSIVKTGQAIQHGLAGVTTVPPVIYIDLGATRGSYDIGGRVPFIDMTWYAEYKPTADALISAFLWIVFVWRMLIHLPGIISGASGIFTITPMQSTHTTPDRFIASGSSADPTYDELLDWFFAIEPDDWRPGEYEHYRAHPPSYQELLREYNDPLNAPDLY